MTNMCFIFAAIDTRYTTSEFEKTLKTKNKRSTESLNENCIHQKFDLYEIVKNWSSSFHDRDRATFRNAHIDYKRNICHFFLFSLVILLHCKKLFLFIKVLSTTFNQLSSNFLSFVHRDEKIAERYERFKHEYVPLKLDIKNISNNL